MLKMDDAKKSKKKKNYVSLEDKVPKKKSKRMVEEEIDNLDMIVDNNPIDEKVEDLAIGVNENGDTWTSDDYKELIKRMEAQIPKHDSLSFGSRSEKLNWEQIKFGNHSIDECYGKWKLIKSKVRHFRLLSEILQDAKVWAEQPWSAPLSKKKVRHPDQPPRPLSSFMLFYMEKKSKIIKKNPELKLTEISRIIGEKYKALTDEMKNYYKEKARGMQEEYKLNLAKFYEKHPELMKIKKPVAQTKKPLPPFKLYLREKLLKHENDENFNRQDFTEKYKDLWKSLSFKKKAYWIRLAKEEEDKFLEHLHDEEGDEENKPALIYKTVISKEEQSILDRLAGKPEKPPNSAYSLFSRLMLQDKDKHFVDGEPKNRMKEVASMWKELPDDQKKMYAERVQHMHEHYKLEMANYLDTLPEAKRIEEVAKLQPKKKRIAKVRQKVAKKAAAAEGPVQDGEELWKNEPKKPPVTAWDLFKTELVKKNSHLPKKAAFKQAAVQWKTLSQKETEKYKKRHQQLKDKYMSDFEEFLNSLNEEELKEYSAWKKAKTGQTFNEESVEEESSEDESEEEEEEENGEAATAEPENDGEELWKNEPKKPPVTAWDLFKTEFLNKNSNLPNKAAFKQAATQWKTLSQKETEKYKKRHQQLKDKYMSDFEEFLNSLNEDELKEYSAWKKAKTGQTFNEESVEEESSEEEYNVEGAQSSSDSSDDSSDESDSGVSQVEV
ncbi:nucleolar transcription factor 1-like [Macrosteles quadrilineatus]|uniref:nucleolar transcription factor 1-like n=1 Tax=Macrosteles quadrilineatus TaxID=74068 RepID=UPI0023E0AF97|nr:nucleolar transcription factor 1-like [Macrosteles quadrilineatus]